MEQNFILLHYADLTKWERQKHSLQVPRRSLTNIVTRHLAYTRHRARRSAHSGEQTGKAPAASDFHSGQYKASRPPNISNPDDYRLQQVPRRTQVSRTVNRSPANSPGQGSPLGTAALALGDWWAVPCAEGCLQRPWPPPTDASRILTVVAARDTSGYGRMSPK